MQNVTRFLVETVRFRLGFGCRTCGFSHKPGFGVHLNPYDSAVPPARPRRGRGKEAR
jgi:hypothetical protein